MDTNQEQKLGNLTVLGWEITKEQYETWRSKYPERVMSKLWHFKVYTNDKDEETIWFCLNYNNFHEIHNSRYKPSVELDTSLEIASQPAMDYLIQTYQHSDLVEAKNIAFELDCDTHKQPAVFVCSIVAKVQKDYIRFIG